MPYICKNCKNKTLFNRENSGRCIYIETEAVNEHGEVENTYDTDYEDYEQTETGYLICNNCNSSDIIDVSDIEWENWNGPTENENNKEKHSGKRKKRTNETWKHYYDNW